MNANSSEASTNFSNEVFSVMLKLFADVSIVSPHHLISKKQICVNMQIKLNFVFFDRFLCFSSFLDQLCRINSSVHCILDQVSTNQVMFWL